MIMSGIIEHFTVYSSTYSTINCVLSEKCLENLGNLGKCEVGHMDVSVKSFVEEWLRDYVCTRTMTSLIGAARCISPVRILANGRGVRARVCASVSLSASGCLL